MRAVISAKDGGRILYNVLPPTFVGMPAFALRITGIEAQRRYSSTMGWSLSGPKEQFTPIASAPMLSSIAVIAAGEAPVISLPLSV